MSPRIHEYRGRHFFRGFSTALVPTEKIDDMVFWHFFYDAEGSHLPYPHLEDTEYPDLDLQDLAGARKPIVMQTDKFRSELLFQADEFQEAAEPYTTQSVMDVLLSATNRKLKLYVKDEYSYQERKLLPDGQVHVETKTIITYKTIKDRVEELGEWEKVPRGKNLLCVRNWDLRDIIRRIGNQTTTPITVVPGLLWKIPSPTSPFRSCCSCESDEANDKTSLHHVIQHLVPTKHLTNSDSVVDLDKHIDGAVIFGPWKQWENPWRSTDASSPSSDPAESTVLGNSDTSSQPTTANSRSITPSEVIRQRAGRLSLLVHERKSHKGITQELGNRYRYLTHPINQVQPN
ncbi:hypothetical protein FAGAP_6542 [Fusarium agapanthi]|uniref:Uncharacterized protein n=1 Tax=Fusarium agapanthi TaxID=1803897 RepID=A0A9P5E6A6_9HYPO|nr:hypothetical protein FAGAP_6542 [Fusarium agapanthi]